MALHTTRCTGCGAVSQRWTETYQVATVVEVCDFCRDRPVQTGPPMTFRVAVTPEEIAQWNRDAAR